jgi:hypothetical protein
MYAEKLSSRYAEKLFMTCVYNEEQRLLPLTFAVADEETILNWNWFMNGDCWSEKITIISY